MNLKYIIDEDNNFALFSTEIAHINMSKGFSSRLVGAGLCSIKPALSTHPFLVAECFGESTSLGLKCRETKKFINEEQDTDEEKGDSKIITTKLNENLEVFLASTLF